MSMDSVDLAIGEEKSNARGFAKIDSTEAGGRSYICRAKGAMLQVRRGRRVPYLEAAVCR